MAIHVVAEGDTLSAIAEAHGSSLSEIISLNPQIANPDLIHPGQEVNVPDPVTDDGPESESVSEATAAVTTAEEPATEVVPVPEQPAAQPSQPAPVLEGRLAE